MYPAPSPLALAAQSQGTRRRQGQQVAYTIHGIGHPYTESASGFSSGGHVRCGRVSATEAREAVTRRNTLLSDLRKQVARAKGTSISACKELEAIQSSGDCYEKRRSECMAKAKVQAPAFHDKMSAASLFSCAETSGFGAQPTPLGSQSTRAPQVSITSYRPSYSTAPVHLSEIQTYRSYAAPTMNSYTVTYTPSPASAPTLPYAATTSYATSTSGQYISSAEPTYVRAGGSSPTYAGQASPSQRTALSAYVPTSADHRVVSFSPGTVSPAPGTLRRPSLRAGPTFSRPLLASPLRSSSSKSTIAPPIPCLHASYLMCLSVCAYHLRACT